eukprot:CAMPEP_0203913556 /NCGR_PEP_ID=MMETSP0359-20131031/54535_1 /ASSEMBLY_ACC=CAM_ASM_000338 /TAXON_ID=268821 /ORGANISM="Scrippsiella Hangoei, Strain SHTV-5" /LENGTH=573 /DNA_ID=CAMNT_0050839721 /DNA_START=96 /DNA_END=1817 /DNA_ORIENTATION=-
MTYPNPPWNASGLGSGQSAVGRIDLEASLALGLGFRQPWLVPAFHAVAGSHVEDTFISECTLARVPLDHEQPTASQAIEILVKRLAPRQIARARSEASSPAHAVWLLSGGPGGSSADDVEPLHALLAQRLQPRGDFEVFILDHRCVGRYSRLGCRWSQAETRGSAEGVQIDDLTEWPGCLSSLALDFPHVGSRHFSVTAAAQDLHMLMERFRRPGQSVSVYGISYGTYWAGRYARLFPGHARAVVLDGVVSASGTLQPEERLTFERWDVKLHGVGVAVLDHKCGNDEFCRGKLGPHPSERVADLFKRLVQGNHCSEPLRELGGMPQLKKILGGLLYGWSGRAVIPALLYRMMRCNVEDAKSMKHFAGATVELARLSSCCGVEPSDPFAAPLRSDMLLRNIVLSELWDPAASKEQMLSWSNQGWFSMEIFNSWADLRPQWPVYSGDALFNTSLSTSSPVLMLNGDTGCQTPLWSATHEFETAKSSGGVTVLTWPDAVHFTALNTPVVGGGDACGLTTIAAFLSNPADEEAWRSPPCRQHLRRIDFRGDPAINQLLWGSEDAYDGSPGAQSTLVA